MKAFELVEPDTLDEALALLDPDDHSVRPIAGGTALMLMMKSGVFEPTRLVSLGRLQGFSGIEAQADGSLRVGAMTSLSVMERSPLVAEHAPVIVHAMRRLANVRVRNVACIGGALAHGDPNMDMPPVMASLGAEVVIVGPAGERRVAVQDLYLGYYETVLGKDELIREVRIPALAGRRAAYVKCTTRSADDWPALGVAVNAHIDDGRLSGVRIVLGAVTEVPTRMDEAENLLEGRMLEADRVAQACEAAAAAVTPSSDARGSAAYKRQLVRVYVGRALAAAFRERT
ncbi:MAG: carbon-monoxide dehydrogenase medium subunit [Massilia sp.]|jgi:carbon-monoxide dehydrogenase medium subunit|nr:carbon-monoxide dehydrogenase medium subunit [Massilia sp.]MDB5951023.1 carbon-monoxide dehydrogenase medium subunit [Massilia sp.]